MESDMAAYKSDFLQEVYECLDIYNQSFVDLENGDTAAIDEIFRMTHTIKGMAGFLGYTSLEHLCHTMEEVLCGIKNGDIEIDGELVDILLSTVDRITDIVKQIENADNDNVKIDDLVEAFGNYDKTKNEEHEPHCTLSVENKVSSQTATVVQQSEENISSSPELQEKAESGGICSLDDCNFVLDVILVKDCVMKGLRASLIIESLKGVSKLAKTEPDENEMDNSFDGHFKVFISGDSIKVEEMMDRISEIEHFNISEIKPLNKTFETVVPQSEENIPSSSERQEITENRGTCSSDDCNLVLDVILVKDCVMKGLRASLIIESLKDISKLAKTEPDENDMDNSFDGHFKVFLSGDSIKVEELMDRISEIEHFNISEIKPLGNASNEEIKCTGSVSKEPRLDIQPIKAAPFEVSAVSTTNSPNSFHSCIYSLIARMRCILSRICKSINCFKRTESAGVLQNNKCEDYSRDNPELQELQVSEQSSKISPSVPDQKLQAEEAEVLEQIPEKVSEKILPEKSIPDPEIRLDKVQPLAENSEKIPAQELQPQEAHEIEGPKSESNSHISEPAISSNASIESKREDTIRVRTSNLDSIMNLVGELVINKGRLLQISQQYNLPELGEATGTLDKSISSLQDEVMRIRMVKIERVFSKFPRMVRDLSRKLNKNIEFEVEGQDTELDRTILDEVSDPLVHLVRNSVDHGVEHPDERIKAGKSETGHIKLSARREKNNVIIEIEDDGKGIDVEAIKRKAVEKGLFSSSDIENLTEEEIRMIIFAPGFSTKDVATEISGRGVGMDAVKTAVEKLGGKVKLYSKKGEFTRVRIDLPPTVAIIKSLLVDVGPETYAIPISNVVKALSVCSSDYKLVKETPLLYIRDKLIPIVELKETFNIECEKLDKRIAIIVEKENEEVGLIVDSIIDQQEIVIKPLGNVLSTSKGFIGATILGDGRVIPIIDVSMLIKGDIDD
ncbi:MAG: two-component system, chemotaxis family, sensor kinase CheA [Euryarchaeota archaeon]|nr:two-component system, chemotaxis family, sensor kinase CheA [Euryarchaeota archaeon]